MLHNLLLKFWNATVLLLLLMNLSHQAYIGMTAVSNNTEINQLAKYTFTLNRQYDPVNFNFISSPLPVTLNSLIAITFPSQFSTISSTTSVTCTDTSGTDLGCTLNAANRTVIVSQYYSSSAKLSDNLIQIIMPSIVNAYISGTSGNFYWEIFDANGTVIDQGPPVTTITYTTAITFTGGTFSSCSITATGAYVSTASTFTFSVTPKNQIPAGGHLVIGIPSAWTSDPISVTTISSTPSCAEVSGIGTTNLACSYNNLNEQLTITGFTTSVSSTFSLTVSTILTPPTVGSGQGISIYSQWSDGTAIDSCTSLVTGLVAAPFQAFSLASNDNTTVQSSFTATLSLTLSRAFYYQDTIVLTLPTEFLSVSVSSVNFATITRTPNLNTLTLSNFPSAPSTITSNNVLTFTLTNITNALSISPLSLTVSFYRSNQIYQTSAITYQATVATLNIFSISATSNFVQAVGSAIFTLDSVKIFPSGSIITLTYPASVTASTQAVSSVTRCSLNGTIVTGTTFEVASNQIIIRNVFSSNFVGIVSIIIPTFTNPPTSQPSSYLLSVTDSSSYGVFTASYSFIADTRALISNSVAANSYTVLSTGVTYTISITTNYDFTAIAITLPTDITVGTSYATTCAPNTFSSCSLSGQNLTFIGTLAAGTYQLSWGYNTNPNSLQPTSSFSVQTYHQGWPVQHSSGVMTVTMNATSIFSTFITYPSAYNNSATVTVTLDLTVPSGAPAGTLAATFPTELGLSSATCTSCVVVPPQVRFAIAAGVTTHSLTVSNVQNVGSFKPISSFTASISNNNSYLSLVSTASGWTNTQASSFTTSVSGSNNYRGQANTFLFSLTGLSGSQGKVRVGISSAFPALSTAPTGATLIDSSTLQYSCSSTSCSLSIALTNPTALGSYTFSITSYTTDNYQVGSSTSNSWTYDCSGTQCRSCHANNSCIDCYSSSISSYSIFNTNSSSCTSACNTGFFLVGNTCTPCDSNCTECISSSNNCTSCLSSPTIYYLDLTYDICVPSCLSGQFANAGNQQCNSCTPPCVSCNITAINCLSCVSGTYLHNSRCPGSCPSGTHIANAATNNCDACSSNCLTCSGSISTCLTCNNTIPLYLQNTACVGSCSAQYFLVANICTACQTPCKSCGTGINDCTSCYLNSSTPVYYSGSCISSSSCPTGHYVNNINSSCQTCPSQCISCSSATSCSVCNIVSNVTYYLSGASCLSVCPNTSYPFTNTTSGYCLTCNNCATCSDSSTCTSCISSQYLYLGVCYAICPNGTYPSGTVCADCSTNCPTCQNGSYCLSCITNYYLLTGICYSICPNGTYSNSSNQMCSSCPSTCATCTSLSLCQTCVSNYSLENSQCVLVCNVGVSINQICYPCGLNCAICNSTTGVCSQCSASYLLYNNICLSSCPSNQLTNDNLTCVPCSTNFVNCSTCSSSACLSCSYGQLLNGTCQPCSPGYHDLSGSCAICPSSCTTCTAQTICQTCATNYYLLGTICTATCPTNMIPNGTVCSQCLAQCQVCNLTNSLCSVCQAGVYLYNNLCYSTCPSPLIVSYDFLSCVTEAVYYEQFSKAAKIIPFPFTIAAVVLIIIGAILRCFYKDMHLQTVLCSLISLVELAAWIIFLAFELMYWQNYHQPSAMGFYCAIATLVLLFIFNCLHLRFYFLYIVPDEQFSKWHKKYGCTNCIILTFASVLTFKFYRLIHSKFLGRTQLSMVLENINRLVPFSLLGVLALFFCSTPICVGCALALYNSVSTDQEFFIALDTLVVTGIMAILILMDLRHSDDYFYDQHEAHNLKKKIYEEDSYKFESLHGDNSQNENGSSGNIQHIEDVEGEASTGQKFKSTFQHTKRVSQQSQAKLNAANEQEQFQFDQSQGDQNLPVGTKKNPWQPVKYDSHGYQIKHDTLNNTVLYDEYGYRVQIDEDGKHTRYNQDGNEVKIIDGKHMIYDSEGRQLINGKPHDQRGYEIREEDGQTRYYDKHGFRVIGHPPDQKHIDEDGNICKEDEEGNIHKYNEDGYEVVQLNGQKVLIDQQGNYVRKNKHGQYEIYDSKDGFTLKKNPQTGQIEKYDEFGFRIVKDAFGSIRRYDQDGFLVTVIPGGMFVRHDKDGYRVEKDQNGKLHRFDQEGYEIVTDENGVTKFIDKHGYRVQRDIYGRVSLFDEEGLLVVIDPQTGKERRYNEQGLEVTTDEQGNKILLDKRGKVVKELDDGQTYQKYDREGNKIYLDENGYEVEYDSEGNIVLFDKVGDKVESEYDINESDAGDFQSLLMDENKKKKYRYKATKAVDNEAELNKLMSIEPFMFDQESQVSDLKEFHDSSRPGIEVDHQYDQMVAKERNELEVKDENEGQELQQFQQSEELDQMPDVGGQVGLRAKKNKLTSKALRQQVNKQAEYDKQALLRGLDEREPNQVISSARRKELNRILNTPRDQEQIQMKSVADVALNERSFDNEGVQPMENKTQYSQLDSIDELELPLGKSKRNAKKAAQTVYNFKTVDVEIKNRNKLYDQEEEIESLHEDQWKQQEPVFARERVKQGSSNANTNILYVEDESDNKDALSDFVHQSESKGKPKPMPRYPQHNDLFSGKSIEQVQQQLFGDVDPNSIRERKQFKLSGAPNPLVQYAKAMQANRKSLQQKMYFEGVHKKK